MADRHPGQAWPMTSTAASRVQMWPCRRGEGDVTGDEEPAARRSDRCRGRRRRRRGGDKGGAWWECAEGELAAMPLRKQAAAARNASTKAA